VNITFDCFARHPSLKYFTKIKQLNFLFVYSESADVNGDDYQNIEIPSDTIPNSVETSTVNVDTNDLNQMSKLFSFCFIYIFNNNR
jgi:hypothetical protein